jgi:CDP-diacylglycerol--glycerol-3-phosphate 3-phosphatidyltransferase
MATTPPSAAVPPDPAAAPTRPAWQRNLPNVLTLARLAMTIAFVAILSIYRFPDTNSWALPTALILFIVAALTDALDGYLARRWNAVSVFGRIMDPFADKILILGAFVMLAGPSFLSSDDWTYAHTSGVLPWMVVVILGRELLVTTIRAVMESRGINFSAARSGKLKMIAQSVGVPAILLLVIAADGIYDNPLAAMQRELPALRDRATAAGASLDTSAMEAVSDELAAPNADIREWMQSQTESMKQGEGALKIFTDASTVQDLATLAFWIALAVTVITALSAIPYITRAITALRKPA